MTTPKHIKKTLLMLAPEHIYQCKAYSSLIALYEKIDTKYCERTKGKLSGYLTCLVHLERICSEEAHYLYKWFSEKDRSEEEL